MITNLIYFASAETADTGIFGSLGIDWKLLAYQTVAFLILLWILSKFVFPVLRKMVEDRQSEIEASRRAAARAMNQAESAKSEINDMLKNAKKEAAQIVTDAKDQANKMIKDSDEKAKDRAEKMIQSANEDIAKEIKKARTALRNETIDMVALATEKVASKKLSEKIDKDLISESIEEAK